MTRPLPRDPVLRDAIAVARSHERGRRAVLSPRAVLGGVGLGVGALALSACAPLTRAAPTAATDRSATDPRLV